ncbi:undecaprenyl-diphosphate phosphatase [Pseudidiomarina terrestris]|uniref:Undecaprenyl-diphosphatase n=1 Tax=Pseudidiomarina terrestris TaxID=2820060 RepID=A0AAW7QWH4_9GAMM|nr:MULTISPECIES: undecaprenyl-diphosphate phosphatase [unclassified Pseudidiomarina]MDN7123807.1 undecaprenyl-diphosphate phosphatase [Pseudidiomarina sp. 1APP75-32.1]MDN7127561.1 undecaprenyl-diphosphate phosphatase [Pseudidiomarina sp. 1APR75-33.1]MDN7130307.1 undecaprenyl-diphosphate phosphatase [Pseudidiomarina sp. 1APR75-15]MDN7136230.1 undecaprenyl-diphosphate phosphatase [Pseudidiomarina sp. 1ASP75-5]MDN7138853.1 undecaprenyl-diphosphate phosphatase [Pseudidiomarina sp. 1ASP75-14]
MSTFEAIILALIQGLTEFLPISSSAHLILPSQVLGWQDQGLAFDVAVHVGTLAAVVFYYRKEVVELLTGWFQSLRGHHSSHSRLAWFIIWATVPAGVAGLLGNDLLENYGRSALVIATTTIGFGLLLWYADARASERSSLQALTLRQALLIGVAQAVALIPGTSRSGITITAGLLLGLTRTDAARFSFLLSIPVILLAGSYKGLQLAQQTEPVSWAVVLLGMSVAFVAAYVCITLFLKAIERIGMLPFVIYRLALGALLLVLFI